MMICLTEGCNNEQHAREGYNYCPECYRNMKTCTVEGCAKDVVAKRRCGTHYNKYRMKQKGECSVDYCTTKVYAKELCITHYNQQRTGVNDGPCKGLYCDNDAAWDGLCSEHMQQDTCTVEGCTDAIESRMVCKSHYKHWYYNERDGEPCSECDELAVTKGFCKHHYYKHRYENRTGECKTGGCDKVVYQRGFCTTCYSYMRYHGDPAYRQAKINRQQRLQEDRVANGLPSNWQEVLIDLYGECLACGTTEVLTADHVVPFSKGGPTHWDNLQVLCLDCNMSKFNSTTDFRDEVLTPAA